MHKSASPDRPRDRSQADAPSLRLPRQAIRDEQRALHALARGITQALRSCLRSNGDLLDPCSGAGSPPDHYAHLFTALALAYDDQPDLDCDCADRHDGATAAADWQRPIEYWLRLRPEQHGHAPFNRLGLRLLEARLRTQGAPPPQHLHLVRQALRACPTARRYPSNNWTALATAVQLLEQPHGATAPIFRRRLHRQLRRWATQAGGFIDFPRSPHPSGRGATPVAYHLKSLLCLWLALGVGEDPQLQSALTRGLDWLSLVLTDQGYCGGFGRTSHGLFGDACLLAVLHGLLRHDALPAETVAALLHACTALRHRMAQQQRHDGLLWLTPGGGCGAEAGWDAYMHLTVYNAWTAGLLSAVLGGNRLLAGQLSTDWRPSWAEPKVCRADPEAGLLRYRNQDAQIDLLLSTHGQPVQGYSGKEVDLRQSAVVPFHLERGGQAKLAPPLRIASTALLDRPELAGSSPIIECAGQLYGALTLESVRWLETAQGLWVEGYGQPQALTRPPSTSGWGRLLAAIDWRLFGGERGRRRALRPEKLAGHYWRLRLELDADNGVLSFVLELSGVPTGSAARWLNPQGSAVLDADGERLTPLGRARIHCGASLSWPAETQRFRWCVAT